MDDTTFLAELQKVTAKLTHCAACLTQGRTGDAEELLQATVVRAYIKRDYFISGTRFDLWAERIMRNIFLNECRLSQRKAATEYLDYYEHISPASNDKLLEYSDVCRLIERLPSECSAPLRMYSCGYKYCEIAQILNLPMSTVKNRIRAARLLLRKALEE